MGNEIPRGQLLAERLHLYGAVAKEWHQMTAHEQFAITSAAEDYEDDIGFSNQKDLEQELDEAKETIREAKESLDRQGIAVVYADTGDPEPRVTYEGKEIAGVVAGRIEWDVNEEPKLWLRVSEIGNNAERETLLGRVQKYEAGVTIERVPSTRPVENLARPSVDLSALRR